MIDDLLTILGVIVLGVGLGFIIPVTTPPLPPCCGPDGIDLEG